MRTIYAEVAQQARVESEAVRKDAEVRMSAMKGELSEATEEIARLEALGSSRAEELETLREANRALELQAGRLEERAEQATRLEVELATFEWRWQRPSSRRSIYKTSLPRPAMCSSSLPISSGVLLQLVLCQRR